MNYDGKFQVASAGAGHAGILAPHPEQKAGLSRRAWIITAIVLAALAGLWFAFHHLGSGKDTGGNGGVQAPVVTVIVPGRTTIAGQVTGTGTIAARRAMPIGSVGEGGGVVRVLVDQGQWVSAGQTLAVVDSSVQRQLAAGLGAQIRVAQADARLAQANLDRSLRLVDRGFISKANIDQLTATRDAAVARVNVARAQLGETQARNRRLDIVSPAAGLVLQRNVEPGQVVSSGSGVLFTVARDGQMEMLVRLSEDDLAKLSVGVSAQVTPVGATQAFTGQVWQITPTIDPATRLGQARIALKYAPGLRPGGFASATINAGTSVAPRLPESAVLSDAKGNYVFVVGPGDKVVRRAVSTGALNSDGIAITAGLDGSERVVLRAGGFLADGETVKPRLVRQ